MATAFLSCILINNEITSDIRRLSHPLIISLYLLYMSLEISLLRGITFCLSMTSLSVLEMPPSNLNSLSRSLTKTLLGLATAAPIRSAHGCSMPNSVKTMILRLSSIRWSQNTVALEKPSQRGAATCQEWIQKVIARHMNIKANTPVKDIQSMIRIQFAENVGYKLCQVARLGLQGGDLTTHRLSFGLLPAYIELLSIKASRAHTNLEICPRTNQFQRVFICSRQSRGSWQMHRFVGVDGTFLKGRFIQQLLLAVGIDANSNTLILAWAVVESENEDSWRYFFKHLVEAILEISEETCVLISDRDKGIAAAEDELGDRIVRAVCCQHFKENFTTKFSRTLKPLFWKIANTTTVLKFDACITELRAVNNKAADYLILSDPRLWSVAHFVDCRFGHLTSNIVETVNKGLKLDRELPIVQLLDALWTRVMDTRFKRLALAADAHESEQWTPWARGKLQAQRLFARTNTIVMRTELQDLVKQMNNNVYTVDLETKECSCTHFQENGIPCGHAISAIFARPGRDLVAFMPEILSINTWKRTYSDNFPMINVSDLQPLPLSEFHTPLTRSKRSAQKGEVQEGRDEGS